MNVLFRFLFAIALLIGSVGYHVLSKAEDAPLTANGAYMERIKKTVNNSDRYKNISSAPSAIKIKLKDIETGQIINAVVGNDDFASFLRREKGFSAQEYIDYMIKNDGQPLEIALNRFKIALGKRWLHKASLGEKYFKEHIAFEDSATFGQLGVKNKDELLQKYFDYDYGKGSGTLKNEYYEKYTRNPSFIALLIDLGYYVEWGDYIPNLNIYTSTM